MLYLAIFGKNVEEAFGRLGSLAFYVAGGLVATVPMRGSRRSSSCSLPVSPRGFYLGGWFLYPFLEGRYALLHPDESGSGVAFAAHVGGFSSACSPPTRSSAPVGSGPGVAAAIGALAVVIATDAGPRATVTQDLQSILVYFLVADALV